MLFVMLGLALLVVSVNSQSITDETKAILVDEFGRAGECDFRSRIDSFMSELSQKSNHRGVVINYMSASALPEDMGSNARERYIANHIAFRNFDGSRISMVRGGYREDYETELWIVPPGADDPTPSRTVAEPTIPEHATLLYAQSSLISDYADPEEFVLQSVKDAEAAELARSLSSDESESESGNASPSEEAGSESESTEPPAAEDEPALVDTRTEEEKEAEKYEWADVGLAKFMSTRKGSQGVMIFYADDQRYDIAKLREFVERGRDLLARSANIRASIIQIRFGGYRSDPEVDFWFVPVRGEAPVATPGERPVPEENDRPADPDNK